MRKPFPFAGAVAAMILRAAAACAQGGAESPPPAISPAPLAGAVVAVLLAFALVWIAARRSTLLKDNLLPQIEPRRQPYSLGRWQMAFWFTLVFAGFVAIWIATGQYNGVVTSQELWLMGISAASGVSAIAVDVVKDSPADAANRGLKALGLDTYADVERVREEIRQRERELAAQPAPESAQRLALEIRDRHLLLAAYENAIRPFVSEGWLKDVTTDLNGAALHRVQSLAWTLLLGIVFVVGVITRHAMPQFDASLLILLGISNAGYVGFKYPEPQQ
ncbi:MAG TPA: hypothetical protein VFA50_12720 [Stellaceae bacterium]|nr:hypothetical protein [Stellaceae bacterium]